MLFVAEAYTGTVLKAFEEQLEAAISLAFFIPLLIGTGGNSGTQITSTLVRAMALGEVSLRNIGAVLRKELSTSLLVAFTMGCAGMIRAGSWGRAGSDDGGQPDTGVYHGLECGGVFYYPDGAQASESGSGSGFRAVYCHTD